MHFIYCTLWISSVILQEYLFIPSFQEIKENATKSSNIKLFVFYPHEERKLLASFPYIYILIKLVEDHN